jgi:hypothetical protein
MEPLVSLGLIRTLTLMVSAVLFLIAVAVGPTVAQGDEGEEEATPTPTSMPAASPPAVEPLASPVAAEEPSLPTPPSVAAGVFADPLSQETVFAAGACPTGASGGKYAGGGFALIVGGRCADDQPVADVAVPARGVTLWDGDIALDFRMAVVPDRARFALYVRNRDGKLVVVRLHPGLQGMTLATRQGETETTLASRTDLGLNPDTEAWNRLAVRVRGGDAWVLINDQPMLYAANVMDQAGSVGLQLIREGSLDDDEETAVVFRDLTLSTLDDTDPARAPTYRAP